MVIRPLAFALILAFGGALACGGGGQARPLLAGLPAPGDAPYELSNDDDLDAQRARLDALPLGQDRDRLRTRLAREYAGRAADAVAAGELDRAYASLQRYAGLWRAEELASPAASEGLSRITPIAKRLLAEFRRSGADHQAVGLLFVLAIAEPTQRAVHLSEIDEIFAFADELNRAEYGTGTERARPLEILAGVIEFLPDREVIDRWLRLTVARQRALDEHVRVHGADFNLIRAHGVDVLRTGWLIVGTLAKAGRLREAPPWLEKLGGLGDDPELRRAVKATLSATAGAKSWIALGARYRSDDEDKSDPEAALAILAAGITAHPHSAELHLEAGDVAFELGRIPLAVRFYEAGLARDGLDRQSSERLAALYETEVVSLALGARVKAATDKLAVFEAFHQRARKSLGTPLKPDLADAYAAMGQGLVSLGDLERAERYLDQSLRQRPTLSALEFLGVIADGRGDHATARGYFERGAKLPVESDRQRFQTNKLWRMAGQAAAAQGDHAAARSHFMRASDSWEDIIAKFELPDELLAELWIETGKLQWALGNESDALLAFDAAIDALPDGEFAYAESIAFLAGRGRYREALDAYHRALDRAELSDEIKVYMSLWMLAEARFQGLPGDPFAVEFIAKRRGDSWQDILAGYSTGHIPEEAARSRATTRRRQSELLFYGAVIHEAPRDPARARALLERVEAGNMILDFEHELAQRWLERGIR